MKSNIERLKECVFCPYFEICEESIEYPQDFEDGSCKTREELEEKDAQD